MSFLLLVLAGFLLFLPAAILLLVFLIALIDWARAGGPAATTTGSNADLPVPSGQPGLVINPLLKADEPSAFI